jgi:amidohydrolase
VPVSRAPLDIQGIKTRALAALESLQSEARDLALRIHATPETAFEEHRAAEWVGEALHRHGYEVEQGVADLPTALIARARGAAPGPTVGLIAEYDALPGLGHACGHNLMAAGMLAAAAALRTVLPDLPGEIAYYGTPAEEGGGGKILMLERGAFAGLDVALQYHAGGHTSFAVGSLAVQRVAFAFTGRPAHSAAAPWKGVNALDAVILTFTGVNALRQQLRPDSRIHGIITDGGQAVNIIPERAAMALGVRAPDGAYLRELVGRVEACAQGAAEATGASLEVTRGVLYDAIKFNPALADIVKRNAKALGFEMTSRLVSASTDLGNLTHALPTLSFTLPTCPPDVGMHTREALEAGRAEIGLTGMLNNARVMVMAAIDLLGTPDALQKVRHDFDAGNSSQGERV